MKNWESMIQISLRDKLSIYQQSSTHALTDGTDLEKKTKLENASSFSIREIETNYLEFPVSEKDIEDFINECGGGESGNVQFRDFAKLYLSWMKKCIL